MNYVKAFKSIFCDSGTTRWIKKDFNASRSAAFTAVHKFKVKPDLTYHSCQDGDNSMA